jgi:hypothetical protein
MKVSSNFSEDIISANSLIKLAREILWMISAEYFFSLWLENSNKKLFIFTKKISIFLSFSEGLLVPKQRWQWIVPALSCRCKTLPANIYDMRMILLTSIDSSSIFIKT